MQPQLTTSYTVELTALRCIWKWTCLQKTEPPHIDKDNVIIIDEQAVVLSMEKLPGIDKIRDLGDAFIKRIEKLMKGYSEVFDRYITESLKEKTRTKRTGTTQPVKYPLYIARYSFIKLSELEQRGVNKLAQGSKRQQEDSNPEFLD